MKRLTLALSIIAAVATVTACARSSAETKPAAAPAPTVAVAKITRGDLAQAIRVAAEFRPFQEIEVHSKVAGFLKSISVDVGDHVAAGQLLAVLEIPELQDDMHQDEAVVRRAEEEIVRAQADLERTESAHDVAHAAAGRLAGVIKERPNLVAQQDVDEATARDRIAEAQVATAKAAVSSVRQQLQIARATQSKTKTLFGYARITAPFEGVITQRYAHPGAMIQAGTSSQTQAMPVVKLSQNSRLRLIIPVPESAVSRVHIGAPVELNVKSLRRTVSGRVARFAERLDMDTRTMRVEVDVPNPKSELVPGMYADATLVLDQAKDVVVAPVEAIDRVAGGGRVFVVTPDKKIEPRSVKLGLDTGDRVQVTSGLAADDLVVVGNRSQLKAGIVVNPKLLAPAAPVDGAE